MLPQKPGIYLFLDGKNRVIYVGKAKDLKSRVSSYFQNTYLGPKTSLMVSKIAKIRTIIVRSEVESLLLESLNIKKYNPKYNVRLTDKKAYPFIRVTIYDDIPKVLTSRREDDPKSIYFGAYPNAGAMRMVLRTIRRIFPFQSVVNHPPKLCFYNHLGLCPCPSVSGDKRSYRKNIKYIIQFLRGDTEKVLKGLTKERDNYSKAEEYEKAKDIQSKINAINLITNPVYKPFEYELNPNLADDLRNREVNSLFDELKKNKIQLQIPQRIECFDISNTAGKFATGSMVVFVMGEPDKRLYKRFKIRRENSPNDYAMMQEVIARRIKHDDWGWPDLMVVDGGKSQVSAALSATQALQQKIPIIGLAKKNETIITSDMNAISISRDVPGLRLLMRIRDETHRFTVAYHRKLRSKAISG